jgi:predicted kinase
MARLDLPGRTLLLVAGMPGAGKTTLLAGLARVPGLVVLDSEDYRAALRRALPGLPYRWYRPVVHLCHRLALLVAAFSAAPTVVVHLPATGDRARAAVARLARLSGRAAHLLWLHVDPDQARRGQLDRGRVVPERSFTAHAQRAATASATLRPGSPPPGWVGVTVLDRVAATRGLSLHTDPATAAVAS